jgi:hypothetical protein
MEWGSDGRMALGTPVLTLGAESRSATVPAQGAASRAPPPAPPRRYSPAATATGFSMGTPMRLPYSVHEPS